VTILFDDELHVHQAQFYVECRDEENFLEDLMEPLVLGGQANGLCGTAQPGVLFLSTGLYTGYTHVTVELLTEPPPVADEWEDVVEASFRPLTEMRLVQWGAAATWPLALELTEYRVRYYATGMDRAHARDTRRAGEPLLDRYLLQLWPAPTGPDAVVRETSRYATRRNAYARTLPPPPSRRERAEWQRQERIRRQQATRDAEED
jgi:hypothetical protein